MAASTGLTYRRYRSIVKTFDDREVRELSKIDKPTAAADAPAALRELALASATFRQALAARYHVSVSDTHAVSYLAAYGPLGQADLARRLSMSTSAVTSLLDRLEAIGVVERRAHPSDRRRVAISVTERGMAIVADIRAALHEVVADLDTGELEVANRIMREIAQRLPLVAARLPPLD